MALAAEALRQGISVGKLINQILEQWVSKSGEAGHLPKPAVCSLCGAKATVKAVGHGQAVFFLCSTHKFLTKHFQGYSQLEGKPHGSP